MLGPVADRMGCWGFCDMGSERLYPLSSPQQAIWLDQLLTPDLPCYNVGVAVQLDGPIDLGRFEAAIQHVVARRDALRTVVVQDECGRQQFLPHMDFALPRFDFSMWADADEPVWEHARREFSIFSTVRAEALEDAVDSGGPFTEIWLLCCHHLIADGTSVALICNAVVDAYNGTGPDHHGDFSYRQFIEQDLRYLSSDRYTKDRQFWMGRFPRLPEPLIGHGGNVPSKSCVICARRVCSFEVCSCVAGVLQRSLLLAVVASLFARLTHDREEIVIGVPLHNRNGAPQRHAIGMFSAVDAFGRTCGLGHALFAAREGSCRGAEARLSASTLSGGGAQSAPCGRVVLPGGSCSMWSSRWKASPAIWVSKAVSDPR